MTRIEKVVREISDLREFHLRIAKERKAIREKDKSLPHGQAPAAPATTENFQDGKPFVDRNK